ncbi:MAG: hypothetical protein D6784_09680 [Chloroflexi bacterium]|nr:MAG: hypothetical protein D6784_09680 [Chloroflexota bacterium]
MIDFERTEQAVKTLKQQLLNGEIDEKTFEDRLLELIDLAADGHYWMFGHQSERWYRHDGKRWVPDDPSRLDKRSENRAGSHNPAASNQTPPAQPAPDWLWMFISLAVLVVIGSIVYSSSLG